MDNSKNGGFTIIESLLFLAASAAMVIVAVNMIGGRNQVVQFQDSMRGFEQRIDLTYSYSVNGTILGNPECIYNGSAYDFSSGNNMSCTVLGYVMEFPDYESDARGSDRRNTLEIYPVFAHRQTTSALASCGSYQLECVEPLSNISNFTTYNLEWGSEVFAALTSAPAGTCDPFLPICKVSAFGFIKLPESGAVVPIAYFEDADFKSAGGSSESNLHNISIDSIIEGGTRKSAIGDEVRFIACIEDSQYEKFGSYLYQYSYDNAYRGEISFEGSSDYVEACNTIRPLT